VSNIPWWGYVILAGLAWGTYVPIIFYGGNVLGGNAGARLMAILCVGVAYFVLGVLFPLVMFTTGQQPWPDLKANGLVFSGLAGVAGAVGAICVIFASSAAVRAAKAEPAYKAMEAQKAATDQAVKAGSPDDTAQREQEAADLKAEMDTYAGKYRLFIAPLIFGLAPVINTLLASIWHPKVGNPWHFAFEPPGWKLVAGIVLVAAGVFLVLYSKEEAEVQKKKATAAPTPAVVAVNPAPPAV
jgi:drug/metabolite transporter (DMT)-like permease